MNLVIRYRDGSGVLTERTISNLKSIDENAFNALCHTRGAERTFVISRVEYAANAETGEMVDLRQFLGLPVAPKGRAISLPITPNAIISLTPEQAKRQRNKDKYELYKPFVLPVLIAWAKERLIDHFSNRCFLCESARHLVIDHHIPQVLGGRLVPGNMVVLCASCNGKKLDRAPEVFYSSAQLERLAPLLAGEAELFEFRFNWESWRQDPRGYLASLGILPELIEQTLTNEEHPLYSGLPSSDEHSLTVVLQPNHSFKADGSDEPRP